MPWRKVALCLVLFLCAIKLAVHKRHAHLDDFRVYNTAAMLVREHQSLLIYNGADTGIDPQLRLADPTSAFARTAQDMGVSEVRLYVYPPLLADFVVPFSFFGAGASGRLWVLVNVAALLAFGLLLRSLLAIPWSVSAIAALALGIGLYLPAIDCLQWGQVTILLLLFWTLGVFFYARDQKAWSALAIAIATALKLTPVIVVVPFLLWRDWRWLRAYALSLIGCFAVMAGVNSPACLNDYFRHVMPAMSNGNPFLANKSLLASCQILFETLHGLDPTSPGAPIPGSIALLGKALAVLCLLISGLLLARRPSPDRASRTLSLSLFAMLSAAIAPVAWEHAYAVCLLPLVVLWTYTLRGHFSDGFAVFLTLCSLELSWFMISFAVLKHLHGPLFGVATFLTPCSAIALVFFGLYEAGRRTPVISPAIPA